MRTIIEVVNVEETKGDDWIRRSVETLEEKGRYFSAFKMQFVEGRVDQQLMEGWESLVTGAKGLAEYIEKENPKNKDYPYKNITAFYPTAEDTEYPQIDPKSPQTKEVTLEGLDFRLGVVEEKVFNDA